MLEQAGLVVHTDLDQFGDPTARSFLPRAVVRPGVTVPDPWRCSWCDRHHPVPSLARACEAAHEALLTVA